MECCVVPIVPIGTSPSFPDVVFKEIGRPFFSVLADLDIDAHFVDSILFLRLDFRIFVTSECLGAAVMNVRDHLFISVAFPATGGNKKTEYACAFKVLHVRYSHFAYSQFP